MVTLNLKKCQFRKNNIDCERDVIMGKRLCNRHTTTHTTTHTNRNINIHINIVLIV